MPTREEHLEIFETAVAVRAKQSSPIPPYTCGEPPQEALCRILDRELFPELDCKYPNLCLRIRWFLGALSYFTPLGVNEIPRILIAHCLRIVRYRLRQIQAACSHTTANRIKIVKQVLDIALALAASWGRKPAVLDPLWDRAWAPAVQELTEMAAGVIDRICHGFDAAGGWIIGAPRGFYYPGKNTVREWAEQIVAEFIVCKSKPKPKYTKYQVLETWEPGRAPLEYWFTRALQGTPGNLKQVEANKFSHGLLYGRMDNGMQRVLVGKVAFMACCNCGEHRMEFGTPRCVHCKRVLEPESFYVIAKDLLVIPGVYLTTEFRRFKPTQYPKALLHFITLLQKKRKGKRKRKEPRRVYYLKGLGQCPHEHKSISASSTYLFVQSRFLSPSGPAFAFTYSSHGDEDGPRKVEPPAPDDPLSDAIDTEEKAITEKALGGFSDLQRIVLEMHIRKSSLKTISKTTGLTKGEVDTILRETIELLQTRLGPLL